MVFFFDVHNVELWEEILFPDTYMGLMNREYKLKFFFHLFLNPGLSGVRKDMLRKPAVAGKHSLITKCVPHFPLFSFLGLNYLLGQRRRHCLDFDLFSNSLSIFISLFFFALDT